MALFKSKTKVRFRDLIKPSGYVPLEVRLGFFCWVIKTGWDYREPGRWGSRGVFEHVWDLSTVNSQDYAYDHTLPGSDLTDFLRASAQRVLLNEETSLCQWRSDYGVSVDSCRVLYFPHEGLESRAGMSTLEWLLKLPRLKVHLRESPNTYHPQATRVSHVGFSYSPKGWSFAYTYALDYSAWHEAVTQQRLGESNARFFLRCYEEFVPMLRVHPPKHLTKAVECYHSEFAEQLVTSVSSI